MMTAMIPSALHSHNISSLYSRIFPTMVMRPRPTNEYTATLKTRKNLLFARGQIRFLFSFENGYRPIEGFGVEGRIRYQLHISHRRRK